MSEESLHVRLQLAAAPERPLWDLHHRAIAARSSQPELFDPWAVDLVDRIDDPFPEQPADSWAAQLHAMRVNTFDEEVRRFLARSPDGTVIALGEGLETRFHRVDNGRVQWLTVDLPETLALRRKLLPDGPRQYSFEYSTAYPEEWMYQAVDAEDTKAVEDVLIIAQGLLMYMSHAQVVNLVRRCGMLFTGGMLFDAVPAWLMKAREVAERRRKDPFREARWQWCAGRPLRAGLEAVAEVDSVRELPTARGRNPLRGRTLPTLRELPFLGSGAPSLHFRPYRLDFVPDEELMQWMSRL